MKLKNEIKRKLIVKLLQEYKKTRSISAACDACDLLNEEIDSGEIML